MPDLSGDRQREGVGTTVKSACGRLRKFIVVRLLIADNHLAGVLCNSIALKSVAP
jgi:hypothetical protein